MGAGEEMDTNNGQTDVGVDIDVKSRADAKKEEGNELYKTKMYQDALARYTEAIDLCPDCAAFYGNRSACYMMMDQHRKALDDAKTAVSLDAGFVKGYVRIAKCCVTLGEISTAKQAILTGLNLSPESTAFDGEKASLAYLEKHLGDAERAYSTKDYRKSLYSLDQCLKVAVASRPFKIKRAECLALLGRYVEAQGIANDILRVDATNADAMFVRGLCLYYEDFIDKAFSHFQQVLRLAPDHMMARETYKRAKSLKQTKEEGNLEFKNSNWAKAHDLYTQALQIDPYNKSTNAKLYCNRAVVAAKLKKFKESVSDCNEALKLDENYLKAYVRRARSYLELEKFEDAVRDLETVNKLDRGNHEYRQLLQQAKLELKKSKRKDYYKILGVDRNANDEDIKRAYRKRALVHHPDRHSGASEEERKEHEVKFKEIGEAYGVLSDSKKRSRYDGGHDLDDLEGHGGHGFGGDIDPNQIFQAFFGGAGGGGGMHAGGGHSFSFSHGGGGNQSAFFQFG